MNLSINVYPNLKKTVTICKADIIVIEMKLFEFIKLSIIMYDSEFNIVDTRLLVLDKSNGYEQWGFSDDFIVSWVKSQISNYPN